MTKKPTAGLAARSVRSDRAQGLIVFLTIAASVIAVAVLRGAVTEAVLTDRDELASILGEARLWVGEEQTPGEWLSPEAFARIKAVLASENVKAFPGVSLPAFVSSARGPVPVTLIGVTNGFPPGPGGVTAPQSAGRAIEELSVALPREDGQGFRFAVLETPGLRVHENKSNTVTMDAGDLMQLLHPSGLAPVGSPGNHVVLFATDGREPAALAFDSAELVLSAFPTLQWSSVDERTGSHGLARLLSLTNVLAILVVSITVFVMVSISFESRTREFALLSSMGFGIPQLRSIAVREMAIVAGTAVAVGIVISVSVGWLLPGVRIAAGDVLQTGFGFMALALAVAFLAIRRRLADRLQDVQREFER